MQIDLKKVLEVSKLFNDLFINININNNEISYVETLLGLLYSSKSILKLSKSVGIINEDKLLKIEENIDIATDKAVSSMDGMSTLLEYLVKKENGGK